MLWTDKIIEHAEKLNDSERKEYFKGLVEGFKMGNYLMPIRGDNHRRAYRLHYAGKKRERSGYTGK